MRKSSNALIAERIRTLRGSRTQREIADVLNITQAYLSEIERGKKAPSNDLLIDIAKKLNTTVSYLLGETNVVILPDTKEAARNTVPAGLDKAQIEIDCVRIPIIPASEIVEACRVDLFAGDRYVRIGVPKADIGKHYNAANTPFAIRLSGGSNRTFGFPDGSRVVVNPEETVHNFDLVLVFYKGELAVKKIIKGNDDSLELMSYDGSRVHITKEETASGDFRLLGKVTSVTLTPNHGL